MIDTTDNVIKKDGSIVMLPKDGTGMGTSLIVGFDDTENIRLAKVTPDGKLAVDASVSVSNISIGEVKVKAPDINGAENVIHRTTNPDNTSALYVQDARLNFSSGRLNTNVYGSNNIISTDFAGNVNVNVLSVPLTQVYIRDNIFPTTSTPTGNEYATMATYQVRNYVNKTIVIKNTGTNSVIVSILGSIDNALNFDIPLSTNVEVLPSNIFVFDESRAFTHIKVIAKNKIADNNSTVECKAYAIGA